MVRTGYYIKYQRDFSTNRVTYQYTWLSRSVAGRDSNDGPSRKIMWVRLRRPPVQGWSISSGQTSSFLSPIRGFSSSLSRCVVYLSLLLATEKNQGPKSRIKTLNEDVRKVPGFGQLKWGVVSVCVVKQKPIRLNSSKGVNVDLTRTPYTRSTSFLVSPL